MSPRLKTFIFCVLMLSVPLPVYAHIGWTLDQCIAAYGEAETDLNSKVFYLPKGGAIWEWKISCRFDENGKVNRIFYYKNTFEGAKPLTQSEIRAILDKNANGQKWNYKPEVVNGTQYWETIHKDGQDYLGADHDLSSTDDGDPTELEIDAITAAEAAELKNLQNSKSDHMDAQDLP